MQKTILEEYQNPPSNSGSKTEISRLWSIPDHQQGIRCKAPRSDDWGVWSQRRRWCLDGGSGNTPLLQQITIMDNGVP